MDIKNLSTLKIHKLSQEQYNRELVAGRIDENAIYLTPDNNSNPDGADIVLDATLTKQGQAADAKAVGDALAGKAKTSDIPTKVSDLTNDSGFITEYTETDPTVPAWAKAATKPSYTAAEVGADPSGTASSAVSAHNTSTSAHNDIRTEVAGKANKSEGAFFIVGGGTTDSTAKTSDWTGTSDRITEYYDGLAIRYKIGVAGQTTTTLNINNLGAKRVYRFSTTTLTTQFPVGSIINLVYHMDLNDGCWMCNDYDANTNTYQRVYSSTNNVEYPITARYATTTGSSYYAEYGRYSTGVTLNPSTNTITATKFKGALTGNADTATKATQDGSGNVITTTYETKADANTKMNNINTQISQLSSEKADKISITLGLHTDGKLYVFIDGAPVGEGVELPSGGGESGDVVGNVDSSNNIIIVGDLADGTYTIKYENDDGTYSEVGKLTIGAGAEDFKNLANPDSSEWKQDVRISGNINGTSQLTGGVVTNIIPIQKGDVVRVKGINFTDGNNRIALADDADTNLGVVVASSWAISADKMTGVMYDNNSFQATIKDSAATKIRFSGLLTGTSADVIITKNQEITE